MNNNLGEVVTSGALNNLNLNSCNLNIMHMNVQSISPKFNSVKLDEIRQVVDGSNFDIIGMSESWLGESILDNAVEINNYHLHRNDKLGEHRGGGVCVYVHNRLQSKVVCTFNKGLTCDAIFVEISGVNSEKILVGVIYLPYGNISQCTEELGELSGRYRHMIVAGDFNINLFEQGTALRNVVSDSGLEIIHNNLPTHFELKSPRCSLIDYFFVSNSEWVEEKGQFQFPALNSHHALIYISYRIPTNRVDNAVTVRDYRHFNRELCIQDLEEIDFRPIYETINTDLQVEFLTTSLLNLYERHVPLRTISKRKNDTWMGSANVRTAKCHRDLAFRAYLEQRNDYRWRIYCVYRNRVKSVIRKERAKHYNERFDSCTSKSVWNELRKIGVAKSKNDNTSSMDVEQFNDCYVLPPIENPPTILYHSQFSLNEGGFSFSNVENYEVFSTFMNINSNAVGPDGLSLRFIKLILPNIIDHVTHVFNSILTSSSYPSLWKKARVLPIPKIRNPESCNDYRPINIVSICSKVLERLMNNQMLNHINNEHLLSDNQSGFRQRHNTTTHILDILHEIRQAVDHHRLAVLISLDFSRAFESISHEILLNKLLLNFRFSITACKLIETFIRYRTQFVQTSNGTSSTRTTTRGVPQGTILGPLLFLAYVNDIFSCCNSLKGYMYADDLQLIAIAESESDLEGGANEDLDNINSWCTENFISLNSAKSKAIMFNNMLDRMPNILLGGFPVDFVSYVKALGFYIDDKLTFNQHITMMISRVMISLRRVYSIPCRLQINIRKQIGYTLLMPLIMYGIEVYTGTTLENIYIVERCFNRIIRYVYGLSIRTHVSEYTNDFLGCSFTKFIDIKILCLFYKVFKNASPSYLASRFEFGHSTRTHSLVTLRTHTLTMKRSFVARVTDLWNNILPYNYRNFSYSESQFRNIVSLLV